MGVRGITRLIRHRFPPSFFVLLASATEKMHYRPDSETVNEFVLRYSAVAPPTSGTLAENSGWAARLVLAEALGLVLAQAQELARCGGWGVLESLEKDTEDGPFFIVR